MTFWFSCAVESGVDDLLVLLHRNRPGEPDVLPQDLRIQPIGKQENNGCCIGDPGRKHDPAESEIQSGHHKRGQKHQPAQGNHRFLLGLLLFCVQSFPQKPGGFLHHNQPCEEHRDKKDSDEQPALPERKGPGRQKQEQAYKQQTAQKFYDCL